MASQSSFRGISQHMVSYTTGENHIRNFKHCPYLPLSLRHGHNHHYTADGNNKRTNHHSCRRNIHSHKDMDTLNLMIFIIQNSSTDGTCTVNIITLSETIYEWNILLNITH
ncbi:Uncharacterized protein TCM_038572 [Theobroma cacao]|uniref:Uncharacterized protein n=1 Tax=Theobroma cacao TaxID=3641 RepID=A0A061GP30_THECC|nr:Uncharacterized protein TCM_038572 [Theobroma cacao]